MNQSIYREAALVPVHVPKNIFRYVEHRDELTCPICNKENPRVYDYGTSAWVHKDSFFKKKLCTVFNRATIRGFWWWKVKCPLIGTHWHFKCPVCTCVWIVRKTNNDDLLKEVELLS
jgi:hypothetical protein